MGKGTVLGTGPDHFIIPRMVPPSVTVIGWYPDCASAGAPLKGNAEVARSTVYRTQHLLKRHGLIDELDLLHLEGERHHYEPTLEKEHLHIAAFDVERSRSS